MTASLFLTCLSLYAGKVFADRGYVCVSLAQQLFQDFGIEFFALTSTQPEELPHAPNDKLLARKRLIIETSIDQFKNVLCGLIVYCHQPKKSSHHLKLALPASA